MDTLESEEVRKKEVSEGKLTRPSEDALFSRKEIIDALKRSDEKKKKRKDGTNFCRKSRIQSEHSFKG